jgi:hypothetical protein
MSTTAAHPHGLSLDAVLAMSDSELVSRTFGVVDNLHDDSASDALYFLVDEVLERFAPEVARAEWERHFRDEPDERRAALAGLRRRQAARTAADESELEDLDKRLDALVERVQRIADRLDALDATRA